MRSSAVLFGIAALVAAVTGQTGMFAHSINHKPRVYPTNTR